MQIFQIVLHVIYVLTILFKYLFILNGNFPANKKKQYRTTT